jgi:hypothetical protein
MSLRYVGTCSGCRRSCSDLREAPETPRIAQGRWVYCSICLQAGHYRTVSTATWGDHLASWGAAGLMLLILGTLLLYETVLIVLFGEEDS